MRKMKLLQMVSVLLVLMLVTLSFAGCGKEEVKEDAGKASTETKTEEKKETKTEDKAEEVVEEVEEELEPVELVWYLIGDPQDDQASVIEEVNKILTEKINATLDMRVIGWGEYDQKMKLKIASGEAFDLCYTSASWVNKYLPNVANGAFLPLDDLLAEYAPNYYSTIPEKYWEATKVNGEIYGAINYQTLVQWKGFQAQKSLVDKYNFDYKNVKTLEDLEPFMKAVMENEDTVSPIAITKLWSIPLQDMTTDIDDYFDSYSGNIVRFGDDSYKVSSIYETDEFMKYIKTMRSWYLDGYIRKDASSLGNPNKDVRAGKYAMWPATIKPGGDAEFQNKFGIEVVSIPIAQPTSINKSVLAGLQAISRTSANPERAAMFLEEVNTNPELYNLLSFGIEGKHYNKVDDVTIEKIDGGGYWSGIAWEFGNQFNAFYVKGQEPGLWEETIKLNEDATASPLLGFNIDFSGVSAITANLKSVTDEYQAGLTTGTLDPDEYYPIFMEKLKEADPEGEVLAEIQKQLDAWVAENK